MADCECLKGCDFFNNKMAQVSTNLYPNQLDVAQKLVGRLRIIGVADLAQCEIPKNDFVEKQP